MDATELSIIQEINRNIGAMRQEISVQGEAIARVEVNTSTLPERVTRLEARAQRQDGERKAFVVMGGIIGSAVTGILSWTWHYITGK